MKAFLAAAVAMAAIAVVADVYLESLRFSSADAYSTPSVRLGE
jgi:hypothetical protein